MSGYLDAIKQALAQDNQALVEHTFNELEKDFSKVLYYVNGVELFKNKPSITSDLEKVENLLRRTDKSVVAYIYKNFNELRFKGAASKVAKNQIFKADCRDLISSRGTRYDFVECEDGSVTFIESYTFYAGKIPICSGLCEYSISKQQDKVCIEPKNSIILISERERAEKIFAANLESNCHFRVLDSAIIEDSYDAHDDFICLKILEQILQPLPKKINLLAFSPNGDTHWPRLRRTIEKLMKRHAHEVAAKDLERIRAFYKSEVIPRAKEKTNKRWKKFIASMTPVFYQVFPSDSHVIGSSYFNYEWLGYANLAHDRVLPKHEMRMMRNVKKYLRHPITLIASFLGLPSQCALGEKPSLWNLGRNLLGWEKNKTWGRNLINYCLTPATLTKNILVSALTAPYNLLRFFTELLPLSAAHACKLLADYAAQQKSSGYKALHVVTRGMGLLFDATYCLGRVITSPIKSASAGWEFSQTFRKTKDETIAKKIARAVTGVTLFMLSTAISATIYTFLFPLLLNLVPALGASISTYLTVLGDVVLPILGVNMTPTMAGVTFAAGVLWTAVGKVVDETIHILRELWWVTYYKSARIRKSVNVNNGTGLLHNMDKVNLNQSKDLSYKKVYDIFEKVDQENQMKLAQQGPHHAVIENIARPVTQLPARAIAETKFFMDQTGIMEKLEVEKASQRIKKDANLENLMARMMVKMEFIQEFIDNPDDLRLWAEGNEQREKMLEDLAPLHSQTFKNAINELSTEGDDRSLKIFLYGNVSLCSTLTKHMHSSVLDEWYAKPAVKASLM